MKNYINSKNEIYGFSEDQSEYIKPDMVEIPSTYTTQQYPFLILLDGVIVFDQAAYDQAYKKLTIEIYESAAQANLESVAQSWGYYSFVSAVSYVSSTNPQYRADAEALIEWRDSYWATAYTIEQGTLPPTAEDFVAMLPAAPEKPVV